MNGKVLVGIPIRDRCSAIALSIRQSYSHDLVLVDTSDSPLFSQQLAGCGFTVHHIRVESNVDFDRIVAARNRIRDIFLTGYWDRLFFVDSDVLLPRGVLGWMMQYDEDVVVCLYPTPIGTRDSYVLDDIEGLGCTLIKRRVLEFIGFDGDGPGERLGSEDQRFFKRVDEFGFSRRIIKLPGVAHVKIL